MNRFMAPVTLSFLTPQSSKSPNSLNPFSDAKIREALTGWWIATTLIRKYTAAAHCQNTALATQLVDIRRD